MKRLLFIYNPRSGKGLIKEHLAEIVDLMVKADYDINIYATQAQGDAINKVINDVKYHDLVVCSGGDGTLDEVVTGMMQADKKVPIGYIPAGSTNDFGNSLGINKDMVRAANIAVNGHAFPCDIGQLNGDSFVYVAAFGLFTEVSYATPQDLKNKLGHAAYILEGAKQLRDIPSYKMQVEYDGNVFYDEFIYGMVTNSMSVGGFDGLIKGDVGLNDGVFEVSLIKMPRNAFELNEILAFLTNFRKDTDLVYTFQTKEIKLTSANKVPWTLDGEYGGEHEVVKISNCQKALEIMVE